MSVTARKILPGTGRGTAGEAGGGGGSPRSAAPAETPLHQPSAGPPPRERGGTEEVRHQPLTLPTPPLPSLALSQTTRSTSVLPGARWGRPPVASRAPLVRPACARLSA